MPTKGSHRRSELAPGWLPSGHFDNRAAHRPDVSLPAVTSLFDDLRCHPVGRALDGLGARVHGHEVLDLLRGTKVSQLDHASVVHKDVGPLYVSVHDLVRVQELKPQQDLLCVHAQDALREGAKLGQQGGNRSSRNELEEDVEGHPVPTSLSTHVPHDVWMMKLL
eukprot:scaffold682747_cov62-Prasinocladus_malaysianus.AAC.1